MVLVLFQIIEVLFQHCKLKCPIKMTKYTISIMQDTWKKFIPGTILGCVVIEILAILKNQYLY